MTYDAAAAKVGAPMAVLGAAGVVVASTAMNDAGLLILLAAVLTLAGVGIALLGLWTPAWLDGMPGAESAPLDAGTRELKSIRVLLSILVGVVGVLILAGVLFR